MHPLSKSDTWNNLNVASAQNDFNKHRNVMKTLNDLLQYEKCLNLSTIPRNIERESQQNTQTVNTFSVWEFPFWFVCSIFPFSQFLWLNFVDVRIAWIHENLMYLLERFSQMKLNINFWSLYWLTKFPWESKLEFLD